MTASSEVIPCGGASSTVFAILFYFLGGKKIEVHRRMLCHPRDLWSEIRHVISQWPLHDWTVGRMDPELSEVDYRNGD